MAQLKRKSAEPAVKKKQRQENRAKDKYPPCHTIYAKNLNDQVAQRKLLENLYILFSTYCQVQRIYCGKLRGQAWVVVSSIDDATTAINSLNGMDFFSKALDLEFGRDENTLYV